MQSSSSSCNWFSANWRRHSIIGCFPHERRGIGKGKTTRMFMPRNSKECSKDKLVAVAVDKNKGSQCALRWATDNIVSKGQTVILVHIKVIKLSNESSSSPFSSSSMSSPSRYSQTSDVNNGHSYCGNESSDQQVKDLMLPFRCFCTRRDIECHDVVLEETDVVRGLIEFVTQSGIEVLVLGSSSKNGLLKRFKGSDIPGTVSKGLPDFCTVYVISKGKISSTRTASRPAPAITSFRSQILQRSKTRRRQPEALSPGPYSIHGIQGVPKLQSETKRSKHNEVEPIKSPFTHRKGNGNSYADLPPIDSDISFVSNNTMSVDHGFSSFGEFSEVSQSRSQLSISIPEKDLGFLQSGYDSVDATPPESSRVSVSSESETADDLEVEMRKLKLELKQTMDMYSTACKDVVTAREKAKELQRWKMEEEQRLAEKKLAEEAARAIIEKESATSKKAVETVHAARRIAKLESKKRISVEMKALKEAEEKNKTINKKNDLLYRRYSIEEIEAATEYFAASRKIGEGGYGPVYRCYLDHTHVAVKILRPDASQGRSQFQQEVEILSRMRHPNMVLLLGACPEYGCLVYEYMSNGSLEDRLLRKGNTPPLSWQQRFQIAADIATGLLFLHQTKPEPLVHRDLKPANILLNGNFISKISDVGLARLVPPSVADSVTQYRMTSAAGTFCYIDPEYQQTGMLGVKSDIYSLGIMFLQIITARSPMGLTHHIDRSIEKGTFAEMLDPTVPDWPVEDALSFAKLSLKCAELRRKDRPDLAKVIMPELERLRSLADQSTASSCSSSCSLSNQSQVSISQTEMSYPSPSPAQSGYNTSDLDA